MNSVFGTNQQRFILRGNFQDEDRVIMSAQANLVGLYPPADVQKWNTELNWQPIPVHTRSLEKDYRLALALQGCDRYIYFLMNYLGQSHRFESFQQNQTFLKYLEMKTGQEFKNPLDVTYLYDALIVEQLQGKW